MKLQYRQTGDTLVVLMPAELDDHSAQGIGGEVDFLVDAWSIRRVVFDFSDTQFMDSSGVGMLIGRKKTMDMRDGTLEAQRLTERVRKIFERSGLTRIVPVREEAV